MSQDVLKSKARNAFTSSKKVNISLRATLFWLRYGFKIVGCLAPSLAEKMALRLFLTPPRHNIPEWQKSYIVNAKILTVKVRDKTIKLYQWGAGPTILLVHGWGGRGSQLSAFISPLVEAGYSVLALDGPAHGASSGKRSDMFEFASAIVAATEVIGTLHAIIAHSFGSACTLLAMRESKIKVPKLVLIGCPSSAIWITEEFADKLSISKKIVTGMRKQLERRYGNKWTWEDLSLLKMIKKITVPTLLVHDRNDHEVPYQQAIELEKANPICNLFTSEGFGHRRILRSAEVINRSLSFIKE